MAAGGGGGFYQTDTATCVTVGVTSRWCTVHGAIRPGVTPLRRMLPNARSHRHSCGEASSPDTTNAYEHTSIHVGLGMFG
jgi:hypothetical protein